MSDADLRAADLSGADMSGADLENADLRGANLQKTNVNKARLFETVLGDVNLGTVLGLGYCIHLGPSIIDFRTLSQSGDLPLPFLRGCGLPDRLIEYLQSARSGRT